MAETTFCVTCGRSSNDGKENKAHCMNRVSDDNGLGSVPNVFRLNDWKDAVVARDLCKMPPSAKRNKEVENQLSR